MSTITKVEMQKNNDQKVNLYLDGEFYSRVYLDTCVKYNLKSNIEIDRERLDNIIAESEKNLALNFSARFVNRSLKTAKQVRDYLRKKEFDEDIIDYVMEKLNEYGFINDDNYIISFCNTYQGKYGKNKLIAMLKQRGISDKKIDEYFNEVEIESSCYNVAIKKAKSLDLSIDKDRAKLYRYLTSRGYDYDEIKSVIAKIENGE